MLINSEMFEQLALEIGLGIGMGLLISIVAVLAGKDKFDPRKFGYTAIVGVISAFIIIEAVEGGIDESNYLKVIIEIAGVSFFANKGFQIVNKIRGLKIGP